MAQKVITIYVCDLCGAEADKDGQYKLNGKIGTKTVDLCTRHVEEYIFPVYNAGKRGKKYGAKTRTNRTEAQQQTEVSEVEAEQHNAA
jgi:hypothetical protein